MDEQLIVAVCGHPELFDTSCYFYRDRNKKDSAWQKVGEEVKPASFTEEVVNLS